jgi:hypothetical protein
MVTIIKILYGSERGGGEVSLYKVIFLGMAVAGSEEEARLIGGLQKKFNLSPEKAERLLQRVPIVVKKGCSKEEMERYVKAFGEIGGRIRVEEEPMMTEPFEFSPPPSPEPVREPVHEREPYTGTMITCPQCGFEQPETNECKKCGIIISKYLQYQEMARSFEGKVREISSEDKYTPWESGEGFIWAFLRTTRDVLFSPTRFFKKMDIGKGYWSSLIYGMISGIIGFGGAILWPWFFFSQWFPIPKFLALPYSLYFIIVTIALPLMVVSSILIGSGVTHLCLMIVGGNKTGYQTTFRVISYSFSGYLFGIIPFIGSTIGGIYALILTIFGVREGHGISTGRAVLAVLLPVIVGVGLGILAAILIPLFFGMFGFFGGVGV